jgi:hypothetical protein
MITHSSPNLRARVGEHETEGAALLDLVDVANDTDLELTWVIRFATRTEKGRP